MQIDDVYICWGLPLFSRRLFVSPKTNISPENQFLEDDAFPFEMVPFWAGTC